MMSYENALEELQNIVTELEGESVSMDALATKVKRAKTLIQFCKDKLRNTEATIQTIL